MSDDGSELLKIGMEVVLRPITEVAENAIGLLGGDWLSEERARNRERLKARTAEILKSRKVKKAVPPSPYIVLPLLTNAQNESRDELLDMWARLLAAAADPARRDSYRREFSDIVKQLEPLDVAVLQMLAPVAPMAPSRSEYIASQLGASTNQVSLSFRNLKNLELTYNHPGEPTKYPNLVPLGQELLALVSN